MKNITRLTKDTGGPVYVDFADIILIEEDAGYYKLHFPLGGGTATVRVCESPEQVFKATQAAAAAPTAPTPETTEATS